MTIPNYVPIPDPMSHHMLRPSYMSVFNTMGSISSTIPVYSNNQPDYMRCNSEGINQIHQPTVSLSPKFTKNKVLTIYPKLM
jgi:hypothetical protein